MAESNRIIHNQEYNYRTLTLSNGVGSSKEPTFWQIPARNPGQNTKTKTRTYHRGTKSCQKMGGVYPWRKWMILGELPIFMGKIQERESQRRESLNAVFRFCPNVWPIPTQNPFNLKLNELREAQSFWTSQRGQSLERDSGQDHRLLEQISKQTNKITTLRGNRSKSRISTIYYRKIVSIQSKTTRHTKKQQETMTHFEEKNDINRENPYIKISRWGFQ